MLADSTSSTSPLRQIIRSFSRREKMSEVWMPPLTVSVTKGMGSALLGGREGVALWETGKGWKVVMLRARVGVWIVGFAVRRARRDVLVKGCIVLWCGVVWVLTMNRMPNAFGALKACAMRLSVVTCGRNEDN